VPRAEVQQLEQRDRQEKQSDDRNSQTVQILGGHLRQEGLKIRQDARHKNGTNH
jgi:hypothetical protein